jgi:3-hydroxyisobutyrate dehydrogenase-like beta-hydroxyacid dehydrogenase
MRVGFIGLGSQGAPMAQRIVAAGHPTTLWARRPAALEPFAGTAARVADSPAALAAESDLVCLCVVNDADVEQVGTEVLGTLASGGVIAVHSTVHPDTCRALAERAATRGIAVVDAAVSGGAPAAQAGTLVVLVGGDAEVVERCRPVFASYGDPVAHLGPLGSGQIAKIINNVLFTANLGTAASALALGAELGIDRARLAEVVVHGSGRSYGLENVKNAGGTLDRIAAYAGELLQKDTRLATELADKAGATPETVLTAAHSSLADMGQTGHARD